MSSYVPNQHHPPPARTELPYGTGNFNALEVGPGLVQTSTPSTSVNQSLPIPALEPTVIDFRTHPFFYLNMDNPEQNPQVGNYSQVVIKSIPVGTTFVVTVPDSWDDTNANQLTPFTGSNQPALFLASQRVQGIADANPGFPFVADIATDGSDARFLNLQNVPGVAVNGQTPKGVLVTVGEAGFMSTKMYTN